MSGKGMLVYVDEVWIRERRYVVLMLLETSSYEMERCKTARIDGSLSVCAMDSLHALLP